jgi:hypothetical protein
MGSRRDPIFLFKTLIPEAQGIYNLQYSLYSIQSYFRYSLFDFRYSIFVTRFSMRPLWGRRLLASLSVIDMGSRWDPPLDVR